MPYINIGKVTEELNELAGNKVTKGHEIIAFQAPTAENNYTWYRKYADGWVEQGGYQNTSDWTTINLPVTMANTNYYVYATSTDGIENVTTIAPKITNVSSSKTVSSFKVMQSYNSNTYYNGRLYWEVKGMYAQ